MLEFWTKFWAWLPEVLPVLWAAAGMTIKVTIGALVVALLLGLAVALMRISPLRPLRAALTIPTCCAAPALVQLFIIYFGLSIWAWSSTRFPPRSSAPASTARPMPADLSRRDRGDSPGAAGGNCRSA
jgi:His/Glu/Gln/Arg/opine family amino acid ABC transporter permease subunit